MSSSPESDDVVATFEKLQRPMNALLDSLEPIFSSVRRLGSTALQAARMPVALYNEMKAEDELALAELEDYIASGSGHRSHVK